MMTIKLLQRTVSMLCVLCAASVAVANAPKLRYTTVDGTVKDTRTLLTWQLSADVTTRTWADARSYCGQLALSGGGWRVPTLKELLTLFDPTRTTAPALDTSVFGADAPSGLFWSSTGSQGSTTTAWCVNFSNGSSSENNNVTATYRVRCVR